ncbi:hypothetical protein B0H14DRAFT_2633634 [Mycena olivaceomarginata]|nr:hypothetical protein B0H14DRAFT_2633634 [Mycena olivaceomarginata]
MPKPSRRQVAATKRHRAMRGEVEPEEAAELKQDGNYDVMSDGSHVDSESDTETTTLRGVDTSVKNFFVGKQKSMSRPTSPSSHTLDMDLQPDWEGEENQAAQKKRNRENLDLTSNAAPGQSTSSIYRKKHGKTKGARAQMMQKSVAHFFKKVDIPPPAKKARITETENSDIEIVEPTAGSSNIGSEIQMDIDSDIECISVGPSADDSPSLDPTVPERVPNSPQNSSVEPFPEILAILPGAISDSAQPVPAQPVPAPAPTPPVVNVAESGPNVSPDSLENISDAAASADDLHTPKETHTRLAKLIDKHLRELRKPKTMLTDKAAANKIFDLEALKSSSSPHEGSNAHQDSQTSSDHRCQ